jgi:hypothetical protein
VEGLLQGSPHFKSHTSHSVPRREPRVKEKLIVYFSHDLWRWWICEGVFAYCYFLSCCTWWVCWQISSISLALGVTWFYNYVI